MIRLASWAKTVVAVLGAVIVALKAAVMDDVFTLDDGLTVVIAALTALGVWATPNKITPPTVPPGPAQGASEPPADPS